MHQTISPRFAGRQAFSLLELLVVITIIAVSLALLMPAVQKVREVANRSSCQNNLRQIGLAFQNHHDELGYYPSGGQNWWTPPNYINGKPALGAEQQAGWGFQILPYLEARNIWQAGAVQAIATPLPVFFCPSRRGAQTITYEDEYVPPLTGGELTHALCDYAASNAEGTGIVRQSKTTKFADITDGTSNTLLAADKRLNLREMGDWQADDNEGYTSGFDEDTIRRTDRAPEPDFIGEGSAGHLFGSSHAGLFNAVFADGSVHALNYSINPAVFRNLGNISDGQAIDSSEF